MPNTRNVSKTLKSCRNFTKIAENFTKTCRKKHLPKKTAVQNTRKELRHVPIWSVEAVWRWLHWTKRETASLSPWTEILFESGSIRVPGLDARFRRAQTSGASSRWSDENLFDIILVNEGDCINNMSFTKRWISLRILKQYVTRPQKVFQSYKK